MKQWRASPSSSVCCRACSSSTMRYQPELARQKSKCCTLPLRCERASFWLFSTHSSSMCASFQSNFISHGSNSSLGWQSTLWACSCRLRPSARWSPYGCLTPLMASRKTRRESPNPWQTPAIWVFSRAKADRISKNTGSSQAYMRNLKRKNSI